MPIYLKQSTASQEIPLGPFVDDTDGKTAETGLTIANTDIKIWKAGATSLVSKNSGGGTHMANGVYSAVLDATDTNTLGSLVIFVSMSGALAVRVECVVLAANIYDSLIGGGDILDVSMTQILGTAVSTPATAGVLDVNLKNIANAAVSASSAQLGVNVVNWKGSAAAAMTGDAFARLGAPAGASVSADVAAVKSDTAAILVDTGTTLDGAIATIDTVVDAIKAKTDNLPSDPADASIVAAATDAILAAVATVDTVVDGIKAVTDVLPDSGALSSLATAAALATTDAVADAIKAQTDQMNFGVTGKIDANITHVNETEVTGDGATGTEWGPA
jgi:hypothetical protein